MTATWSTWQAEPELMVDADLVAAKLGELGKRIDRVRTHVPRDERALGADPDALDLVSFNLLLCVQAALDVGSHIIAGIQRALRASVGVFVWLAVYNLILGLSLANAVFVDEMTMDNTDALDAKVDRLYARMADVDHDRQQELRELRERLDRILTRLPQA